MTTELTLPIQVTRYKIAQYIVPFVLVGDIIMACVVYIVLGMDATLAPEIRYMPSIVLVVMAVPACMLLLHTMSPATIDISRTGVKVTPLSVMGIKRENELSRSLSDFVSLDLMTSRNRESGVSYHFLLRGKPNTADIRFDVPKGVDRHQFAAQLGAALNLKVNDNA